jgi:hypothetical protein
MNRDLVKGVLIAVGLVVVFAVGGLALTDNGWRKASCVGRAIASGVSFTSLHAVCGL